MKLYVIPVEKKCNANCKFCITKYRNHCKEDFLKIENLKKVLKKINPDSIEITGGGEPLLHPQIRKIIDLCTKKAKTQIYTNGALMEKILDKEKLKFLCLSRAHHDSYENFKIMGIKYDLEKIKNLKIPLKLSALLHKSGLKDLEDVKNYVFWAKKIGAKKIVFRQLFEDKNFLYFEKEYISTKKIFEESKSFFKESELIFYWNGMEIEFEFRSNCCEFNNPVLHADGKTYLGWGEQNFK